MNKKVTHTLFLILLLAAWVSSAHAYTLLTLDSLANAGSASNPYAPYLNIRNLDAGVYHYQWNGNDSLPWNSLAALYEDLADEPFAWSLESAGDVFFQGGRPDIVQSISLSAGAYTLSLYEDSAYNLQGNPFSGAVNQWNAYVQFFQEGGPSFAFGDGGLSFNSETAAVEYYRSHYNGMQFYLPQDTTLYYFINDINSIDNLGSITLALQAAPVPEPGTLLLLGSGAALLAVMRRRRSGKRAVMAGS
jgi:hypothetical protein